MKLILPIILAIVCIALGVWFYETEQSDNAQHDSDVGATTDFSNRLTTAQSQITADEAAFLTISNNLDGSRSDALVISNHLMEAQSAIALGAEQITNLNQQIVGAKSDNTALGRQLTELTNQIVGITKQLEMSEASLAQTNAALVQAGKDYGLLENRFRIDVGERTVVERKFNNPAALKAQMENLKKNPATAVSADSIYAGLNVEVKSNGWIHVIAPN